MGELFIVGAQRSGSTYLYQMLDAHPEVLMAKPVRPEPKFFLNKSDFLQGKGFYEQKYFSDKRSVHKYVGEKSTSYIESLLAAERIKSFYPNAKILVVLRNPVTRAYSNYRFSVDNGIEHLSFEDALLVEHKRLENHEYESSVNPFAYLERGKYINYLNAYLSVFDISQIHIMVFEELVGNKKEIARLFQFLDIDSVVIPKAYELKVNASSKGMHDELRECSSQLLMNYEDSIQELELLLGRGLDIWRRFESY